MNMNGSLYTLVSANESLFDSLHPSQQFFSYVGMGLPGLNHY